MKALGEFITKWKVVELKESSAAQSHFNDLCRMLDETGPTDADPTGEWYCFEKGAPKSTGGEGWADVWKRDPDQCEWCANSGCSGLSLIRRSARVRA